MDARWGWALAAALLGLASWEWGWRGGVLALTVVVFWLLLQFSRSLRVLRQAGGAPKGRVPSAVMLHSRLRPGLTLMQLLPMTGSLGEPQAADGADEAFAWTDDGGDRVVVVLRGGKLVEARLERALQNPS